MSSGESGPYVLIDDVLEDIEKRFTYHPPHSDQVNRYELIRARFRSLALFICTMTPRSREQSLAITKLEEAMMWTNAGMARNETAEAKAKRRATQSNAGTDNAG